MKTFILVLILAGAAAAGYWFYSPDSGTAINSRPFSSEEASPNEEEAAATKNAATGKTSNREIAIAEEIRLPVSGSAPTSEVKHSIPISEIRRGCPRQDCIPSVDDPEFMSVAAAAETLPVDTIGISLSYKGVDRFYPFNMLVTREIVNDIVAGDPLLITYCPLCGTGIVFDRTVNGEAHEFGVSGMLWQSNLLMYNRADNLAERNLWSQVLGEAVVGPLTGTKLEIIPSNIVRFSDWQKQIAAGEVLNTGRIGDPYNGRYYEVARNFAPNFDESSSKLPPSAYVLGVEIDDVRKAYPRANLPVGTITDTVGDMVLTITKAADNRVTITNEKQEVVPSVAGFWFSWVSAHPNTKLWQPKN